MLVSRWQATVIPSEEELRMIYEVEGLVHQIELFPAGAKLEDHRHPFDEVRTVISGELLMDIAGNKLLLRAGDKIVVPSNTRHSKANEAATECRTICAYRIT